MAIDRRAYSREGREAQGQGGGGRDDETELIQLEPGELFEGVFVRTMEPIGRMKSPMHFFIRASDEAKVKMWGYTVLDDRMTDVNPGEFVELTYNGKVEPEGGGNAYHSCSIQVYPPMGAAARPQSGGAREERGGDRRDDRRPAGGRDDRRGDSGPQRGAAPARGSGGSRPRDDVPPPSDDDVPF